MPDTEELKIKAETAQNGKVKAFLLFLRDWFFRNKIYFIAFLIPVVIMYAAYAIFKIYPFGDESVLVLDLNGQYVYYFEALRDAFWGSGKSILYNWSRNLSGGFAGIIGYYLASPYTLIVLLLPRTMLLGSLLIMQLAKIGSSAVTFCYYLQKSKKLSPMHSLIFSQLYALCAYGVIQLIDPMWLDALVLLPLIVLGIEYLIDDGRKLNFIIPLAIMMVANFYIGYMVCIFTALYFFYYVIFGCKNAGRKNRLYEIWQAFVRIGVSAAAALACAAFMILPVYNALALGKFDFSDPSFKYATQFNPLDFLAQLMVAQYDSVNVQGLPEIYCGLLTLVLVPLFFLNKQINTLKRVGYAVLAFVLFGCMCIRPIDMVWHGFQMPNWLPFRYSFTFSFVLLCMAAETVKNFKGVKLPAICGTLGGIVLFLLVTLSRVAEGKVEHIAKRDIWICIAFAAVYSLIVFICTKKEKLFPIIAPIALVVLSSGELIYNCVDTLKAEDKELSYSTRSSWYNFIDTGKELTEQLYEYDDGFYRADKTESYRRTVNDNVAFGLRGISHSSSVMNARTINFLAAMGYYTGGFESDYGGSNPLADSVLGIKYSIDKNYKENVGTEDYKRYTDPAYNKVFSYEYKDEEDKDCIADVYENPYALSIGFMADETIKNVNEFGTDNIFKSQNILLSTLCGDTDIDLDAEVFRSFTEYFKSIDVDKNNFILNSVSETPYGENQTQYTAGEGDPTVDMIFNAPSDNPIYIFFKTDNQKKVNLWINTEKDENGNFTSEFDFINTYFEDHHYCTMCLGSFEPGTEIDLRMTVANEYTIVRDFFFYELDEDLLAESINQLKQNQWEITKASGRSLEGTITAESGQMMMTSIPYEPGWTVRVDGKKTEPVEIAKALIGVNLEPGEHTVKMTYTPPGLTAGIVLLIAGIGFIVVLYKYDKKNNKVMISRYREKHPETVKSTPKKSGKKHKKHK
ncbi:MAG: YfhO family protein [Clostridium sp.]|nr:YfhO family protein [Clostridium sp.]MCM1548065.1 YfhO family protein [Ruminococcus sp.]